MNIRQTNPNDLDAVMETYSIARKFMFESGNKTQWQNGYPYGKMIYILKKFGFTRCGNIYLADGAERIAYQIRRQYS